MFNITNVRNARYFDDTFTRVDLEIEHPEHGWIPYLLTPEDTDTNIDNEEILSLLGDNILPYVPPSQEQLDEWAAAGVRHDRAMRLEEVDTIAGNALRWSALDADTQAAWSTYRQALLDVTSQSGFPHNVTWPTKPS